MGGMHKAFLLQKKYIGCLRKSTCVTELQIQLATYAHDTLFLLKRMTSKQGYSEMGI